MKSLPNQSGYALVTLLFFIIISITISTGAVVVLVNSMQSTTRQELGLSAYYIAESGIENAILRLLRDPNYIGETLVASGGTTIIQVTKNGNQYTIRSEGTQGNFTRTIQASALSTDGILTITQWEEVE